jgi:hypothetical protein
VPIAFHSITTQNSERVTLFELEIFIPFIHIFFFVSFFFSLFPQGAIKILVRGPAAIAGLFFKL